jgi:OmpA-OmpF porin, OOP family
VWRISTQSRQSVAATLATIATAFAAAEQLGKDVPGGVDHPMVSRYAGSVLIGYELQKFGELRLPLSTVGRSSQDTKTVYGPKKEQRVEGKLTRLLYVAPEERSSLELLRSYEGELKKNGFEPLYTCAGEACGSVAEFLYPPDRKLTYVKGSSFDLAEKSFANGARDARYAAFKRSGANGDTHVSLLVAKPGCCPEFVTTFKMNTYERMHVLLEIVESAAMSANMVTVNAAAMAGDITRTGRTALYGIFFDTGKSILKPESTAVLNEIAALLKNDPGLRLHVVGHTDNVGTLQSNLALSESRAAAVVQALTSTHGVAATRLRPAGVGSLAPVAPNDTEDGRAKNRRVELVKQ